MTILAQFKKADSELNELEKEGYVYDLQNDKYISITETDIYQNKLFQAQQLYAQLVQ